MRRQKSFWLFVVLAMIFGALPMHRIRAASEAEPVMVVSLINGEVSEGSAGIPITAGNETFVFAASNLYSEEADYVISPLNSDSNIPVAYAGNLGDSIGIFTIQSDDPGMFYTLGTPVIGEKAEIMYFLSSDGQNLALDHTGVTITACEYESSDGGLDIYRLGYEVNDTMKDGQVIFPVAVVNDQNQLVAYLTIDGEMHAITEAVSRDAGQGGGEATETPAEEATETPAEEATETPEEEQPDPDPVPDPDPNGFEFLKSPWFYAALIVLGAVVVMGSKNRKGKNGQNSQNSPSKEGTPTTPEVHIPTMPINYQTRPVDYQTRPEDIPSTEPVPKKIDIPPTEPEKVNLYLVGVDGAMTGFRYGFTGETVTIGRALGSTICYPADTKGVSRRHCQIFRKDGRLMLMDLGSTSGTFLQGKGRLIPHTAVTVAVGDTIYIGSKNNALRIQEK